VAASGHGGVKTIGGNSEGGNQRISVYLQQYRKYENEDCGFRWRVNAHRAPRTNPRWRARQVGCGIVGIAWTSASRGAYTCRADAFCAAPWRRNGAHGTISGTHVITRRIGTLVIAPALHTLRTSVWIDQAKLSLPRMSAAPLCRALRRHRAALAHMAPRIKHLRAQPRAFAHGGVAY